MGFLLHDPRHSCRPTVYTLLVDGLQNIGHAALAAGHTVRFTTLAAALADLLQQESMPAFERRLKHYIQPAVLVLDELGYLPCDSRAADLLHNIISRRHEQRSAIISTNLAFKQWGTVFPGAACVVALVDRFAQHCHRVEIDADSWPDKHSFERDDDDPSTPRRAAARPNRQDALQFAKACAGGMRLSKFQPWLPGGLLDEFLADAIDHDGAARVANVQGASSADG
jgi:hypothetical protein